MKRFPIFTVAVIALSMAAALSPSMLVYDRERIISGELWRNFTCNLVHFSSNHLTYNALVFGVVGWLMESRAYREFGWLCLLSPGFIGLSVFLTRPDLQFFGGLSGLATAAVVLLALRGLRERNPWPCIAVLALGATAIKIVVEFSSGHLIFADSRVLPMKPVPEAHLAGAFCAAVIWTLFRRLPDRRHKPRMPGESGRGCGGRRRAFLLRCRRSGPGRRMANDGD